MLWQTVELVLAFSLGCLAACREVGGGGCLPQLPPAADWDGVAGGRAAGPKAVWGEHPDLPLLAGRGQGTEMSPRLHDLHAQALESLGQTLPVTCTVKC